MPLHLVTDRTQADVDLVHALNQKKWADLTEEERNYFLYADVVKGAYNHTDLIRVETAVQFLANELNELGFPVWVNVKTNWTRWDIPTGPVMVRYLHNLQTLRNAVEAFKTLSEPLPSDMAHLTFEDANRIERLLQVIEQWVTDMRNNKTYTGELFCGE